MDQISLREYYCDGPTVLNGATDTIIPCKVVAVLGAWINARTGQAGDWAAYWGPSDWSDAKIATSGDKISREAAEALFPTLPAMGIPYR